MPENIAEYSFLPWVRVGLGNEIVEADTFGGSLPSNATLERPEVVVRANVKASKGDIVSNHEVSKQVKIQGPGDVLGINTKTIIRTHPKKGVTNFETNNLCYVEFYEEDLPWRFTPAHAVGNKLRPWLALIVLRKNEFEYNTTGGTPTPFISINATKLADVFYSEKDTYALAHVHVLEDLGNNNQNAATLLQQKLAKNPDLALSRLLCPRKLEYKPIDNEYVAFIIPAFETGRLAGMGLNTAATKAQTPSWSKAAISAGKNPTSYPYYFSWSFKVSSGGDFESLAEKLTARELPANIGKREIDLTNMGFGIAPTGNNAISFVEGAMKHPDFVAAPWPVSGTALKNQLRDVLNISANLQDSIPQFSGSPFFYSPALDEDPIIAPPTFGKWHKGVHKLTNAQNWVHDLNLSPKNRAAAGLGVRVVQQHQEEFVEMAWEQIGEINEANQKIIENELAKRVATALANAKIEKMPELYRLQVMGKTLGVLKMGGGTALKTLADSKVPTALRSGAFLKVANNYTPTALMTGDGSDGATKILNSQFLARINATEQSVTRISAAPARKNLAITLPATVALAAIHMVVKSDAKSFMQHLAIAIASLPINFTTQQALNKLPASFKEDEIKRAQAILDGIEKVILKSGNTKREVTVKPSVFDARISTAFAEGVYEEVKFKKVVNSTNFLVFNQSLVFENRLNYQQSFEQGFLQIVDNKPVASVFNRALRPELKANFALQVFQKLNPKINYFRKLNAFFAKEQQNLSKPIMAYPRFPLPMYDYLKDISPDYIIPNISEIKPDTITLMETNQEFIESFLAGMNHEFSRELLWREFPTDMRGSYFRHFWEYNNDPDAEIRVNESVEAYTKRILSYQNLRADVKELHKWQGRLGHNQNKLGLGLVLLIKGDLFRKYPNTLVYAQKAKYKAGNKNAARELTDYTEAGNVKWPVITGKIEPDVYFFGFELTQDQANGNRTGDPGWFFVLRERPGQISFGLDDLGNDALDLTPANWNQVTWQNVSGNANVNPKHLKIDGTNIKLDAVGDGPRGATWGASSSDMAYILYQSPVLFARHASTMLND